eukprot:2400118-Amphidinium_carterae.1
MLLRFHAVGVSWDAYHKWHRTQLCKFRDARAARHDDGPHEVRMLSLASHELQQFSCYSNLAHVQKTRIKKQRTSESENVGITSPPQNVPQNDMKQSRKIAN